MLKIIIIILSFLSLSSCLPAAFTAAAGSTMAVAKDRTISETMEDVKISAGIKADLIKKGFKNLYAKISVQVLRGRVLLTGDVHSDEEILTAVEVAWNQNGVVEVANELSISNKSNHFDLTQYTRDSLITSQIKSKIFVNRQIKFVNYTIVTLNDVVYIFGIARNSDELNQVSEIASKIRGVAKVVSYAIIKDSDADAVGDQNFENSR